MILECKDLIYQKENIKELGGVLTGINKNLKQNEDFEMKKQMVMFEKLLKIVDVSLINRSLAKEILEKSLSNFINISTKSGNELQVFYNFISKI